MNHLIDFITEYQSVIMIIFLNAFFFYIQKSIRYVKRNLDLMRIKQEAMIYASMKVNGKYRDYSEEWHQHYNSKLNSLKEEYKFLFT